MTYRPPGAKDSKLARSILKIKTSYMINPSIKSESPITNYIFDKLIKPKIESHLQRSIKLMSMQIMTGRKCAFDGQFFYSRREK